MARKPAAKPALAQFAALLAKHLADGTRPAAAAGEPWTYAAFAAEVPSSRDDGFVSERTVSNWCNARTLPEEIDPILRALFGPASSERHAEAREQLRQAFLAARAEKNAAVIARAKPDPVGQRWIVEDQQLVIDRTERATDLRAANDPSQQQFQLMIRDLAASLADKAKRLSNSRLWGDLSATAMAFHAVVDRDPLQVPRQLTYAYAALLRLGRFLETDARVREDPAQDHEPLDPDIHGSLTDLVRIAAPWLRRFPKVAAWDDEAGKALVRTDLFRPARDFTQVARRLQTIPEQDAAEMELLAATADADDYQGRKAGNRAVGGAKNLMLAAAMLVAAASLEPLGSGSAARSLVARRAGMTLAEGETEVEAFVATLPHDLQQALRALVLEGRRLSESMPSSVPPTEAPIPEDVEAQARAMILEGRTPPSAWWPLIRSLAFRRAKLETLTPLSGLTALQYLDLRRTKISDVAPLSGLTALRRLDLRRSRVSNVAPLATLTGLQNLSLMGTLVSDVAPLSGLTALQYLDLRSTLVSDVTPLSGLTALQNLDLRGTGVGDVTPLSDLTVLQHLDLRGTAVSDVARLSGLTALQHLDLWRTRVNDVAPLSGLSALQHLDLGYTKVSDMAPLSGLTALQLLDLRGTGVSDVAPLSELTVLKYLNLMGTAVSDVARLSELTALQYLDLRGTGVREVPRALAERLKEGLVLER